LLKQSIVVLDLYLVPLDWLIMTTENGPPVTNQAQKKAISFETAF